ncbi:MAG: hypothetical protein OCC49_18500 [Fibrobacterales bacterium]
MRTIYLTSIVLLTLIGCAIDLPHQSTLSDTELTNPELFSVTADIFHTPDSQYVSVSLVDSYGDHLSLLGGTITLNSLPLKLTYKNNLPFYHTPMTTLPNTTHLLTITLSDGTPYNTSLVTQPFNHNTIKLTTDSSSFITIGLAPLTKGTGVNHTSILTRHYNSTNIDATNKTHLSAHSLALKDTLFDNSFFNPSDSGSTLSSFDIEYTSKKWISVNDAFRGGYFYSTFTSRISTPVITK